jgi:hypothetical protein
VVPSSISNVRPRRGPSTATSRVIA